MDKDEFCKLMKKVMDAMPSNTSKEIMSLIIANMLMQYEIENEWPVVMTQVTHILSEAMAEARAEAEAEDVATAAADAFLKNVLETHNQG